MHSVPASTVVVNLRNKLCETPNSIATHLWLAAVRIEDSHAVVSVVAVCGQGKNDLQDNSRAQRQTEWVSLTLQP